MSVPQNCTILVIGGGPAGSYAAAALAREGFDVVVLEAEQFPRYHVGESMLPSMRHFLKFIDGYDKWNEHGFRVKNGGAFRLDPALPDTYTDFIASGGPEGYAWNVIRSQADELLFKHAGSCGAKTFDSTKVTGLNFESYADTDAALKFDGPNPGRPVSATWKHQDGSSGKISFEYLVDASGRRGILSTQHLKNRKYNQGLKNIASWGYWKGGGVYGPGTYKEGSPYFEALSDASGWCWFIPLQDGTHSVGIVQNQDMATAKKRAAGSPPAKEFYFQSLDLAPGIKELLSKGELVSEIRSASDWSYSASAYAFPYARIAGDAGSFIDPFFSSGVHLALHGGLSAAVTIAAAIRGDCDENTAALWHTKRTSESYTRFLLIILSAAKQIRNQNKPVIHDFDEDSFERAFDLFRPIIQGTVDADAKGELTQEEISNAVEFCFRSFADVPAEKKDALIEKLKGLELEDVNDKEKSANVIEEIQKSLTPEESQILDVLRGRRMIRGEDSINLVNFTLDSIDGLVPNLKHGKLGLVKAKPVETNKAQLFSASYLRGGRPDIRTQRGDKASKASKASKPMDQESKPTDQESKPTDQESKPTDQESKLTDQESKPTDQESKPTDQESKPTDQESKPMDQEGSDRA
ncbi:FAD/NAD(P)-binding domain-containing protein, partial [Hypoxylon sp. FL0890]